MFNPQKEIENVAVVMALFANGVYDDTLASRAIRAVDFVRALSYDGTLGTTRTLDTADDDYCLDDFERDYADVTIGDI